MLYSLQFCFIRVHPSFSNLLLKTSKSKSIALDSQKCKKFYTMYTGTHVIKITGSSKIDFSNINIKAKNGDPNGFAYGFSSAGSSFLTMKNVNVSIDSYGEIRAISFHSSSNIDVDNVKCIGNSLNQWNVYGIIIGGSNAVAIRNAVIDNGPPTQAPWNLALTCENSSLRISNSELRGKTLIVGENIAGNNLLINNTMMGGQIQASDFSAVKCFNTFDANNLPYACQ